MNTFIVVLSVLVAGASASAKLVERDGTIVPEETPAVKAATAEHLAAKQRESFPYQFHTGYGTAVYPQLVAGETLAVRAATAEHLATKQSNSFPYPFYTGYGTFDYPQLVAPIIQARPLKRYENGAVVPVDNLDVQHAKQQHFAAKIAATNRVRYPFGLYNNVNVRGTQTLNTFLASDYAPYSPYVIRSRYAPSYNTLGYGIRHYAPSANLELHPASGAITPVESDENQKAREEHAAAHADALAAAH